MFIIFKYRLKELSEIAISRKECKNLRKAFMILVDQTSITELMGQIQAVKNTEELWMYCLNSRECANGLF
jgi:hypothetical protein